MGSAYRFNVFVDEDRKVIITRPIGDMPGSVFVERLFDAYASVTAPWTYGRISDFRRFEGFLDNSDLAEIARRWKEMTVGIDYHAYVAVVSTDVVDRLRIPAVSPQFPNETICLFTDYHEAMGWLLATDREAYLERMRLAPRQDNRPGRGNDLHIE